GWSGTSMACPNASGSAALLVEYYKELFSNGAMWASTLKGLIIHTADDLGNAGPDYKFGWGLMNTQAAADLLADYADQNLSRLTEAELTTADAAHAYTVLVGGDEPLRVTLCWTDPAASENYDELPDLINDLNLRVVGPGGTTVYPYVLDKSNPQNAATRGVNDVDNVEQVYIASPSAGLYTIIVDCEGTLLGSEQEYSLLMSGISSDSDGDDMPDYWEKQYFSSATGAVATADADHDGADNLTEYVAGTIPDDAASVFEVTTYSMDADGAVPFTLNWTSVEGRIYNVMWSNNLRYEPFAENDISGDLPYPANSFTDTNETRAGQSQFYRLGVRLAE
uniref:S8 family serine peptidase n=1 Tax=Pontiella sp. TaxID=2837462 RepID=UPI0035622F44